jgi:hypothetical protein
MLKRRAAERCDAVFDEQLVSAGTADGLFGFSSSEGDSVELLALIARNERCHSFD